MRTNVKKAVAAGLISMSILGAGAATAYADTVFYKGLAVHWNHGRTWSGLSYSNVYSSVFEHSATANTSFSGWQRPGIEARASQWVGFGRAYAYWNCRG